MSTRCQIGFYESTGQALTKPSVVIYRHHDGYPTSEWGVLATLVPVAARFHKERGLSDASYAGARILQALMNATAPDGFTGYGIDGDRKLHGDIDFYYRVDPSGVTTYKVTGGMSRSAWHGLTFLFHTSLDHVGETNVYEEFNPKEKKSKETI